MNDTPPTIRMQALDEFVEALQSLIKGLNRTNVEDPSSVLNQIARLNTATAVFLSALGNGCPICGSTEISRVHAEAGWLVPETYYWHCNSCNHQWGYA